ncbi:hypothetical protein IWX47DRAFT_124803 [Phyllosticta citricarpa]
MVGRHLVYLSFALLSSPLPTGHVVSAAEAPSTITRPEMHSGTLSTRIQCLRLLMRPGLRRRAAALASMLPEPRPKPHRYEHLFSLRHTPCTLFGTGSASCNLMRDTHSYRSFCHPHLSHFGADVAGIHVRTGTTSCHVHPEAPATDVSRPLHHHCPPSRRPDLPSVPPSA